jgi:DNA mismatch endonuclease (patch repair protein)
MADNHSKEIRSYNMSRIRSQNTKPEVIVRKFLFSKGLRYRKNDRRYPGRPDIVLPKYKTIIFINGCFWHMHENCSNFVLPKSNLDYWLPKLTRNKENDKINIDILVKNGWNVITIWECELKKNVMQKRLDLLYNQIINNKFI